MNDQNESANPMWQTIYTYSRAQAIADGFQIEVTKTAQEAGIRFPVFITRGVYEQCVAVPPGVAVLPVACPLSVSAPAGRAVFGVATSTRLPAQGIR